MPRLRLLATASLLAALAACTPRAVIPELDRQRVASELTGQQRWLRVAVYVAPFWGDKAKALVSDAPLEKLDLVETPAGAQVAPPPAERILMPGTSVRVREVEFPTGWVIAQRVVMTPRYHPWVLLDVPGDDRTYVLVLQQTAASYDEVRWEVDRVFTTDDPSAALAAMPVEQRDAVGRKELVEGMSPRAVEMAWGLPEKRRIDRPAATEEWSWAFSSRRAFFLEDRLQRWER